MIGSVFSSNTSGDFTVTGEVGRKWEVTFNETGFKTVMDIKRIRLGTIKDPFHRSIRGVGYLGVGNAATRIKDANGKSYPSPLYILWTSMMKRCYDPKLHVKSPTYIGCSVHPDWHCFQDFAESVKTLDGYEQWLTEGYELDKDKLVEGNKIYSPSTCCFLSKAENVRIARVLK